MLIREATAADLPLLIRAGEAFLTLSKTYGAVQHDRERITNAASMWAESPNHVILLAEQDNQPVGFFIGYHYANWFDGDWQASDIMLFVLPTARGQGVGKALLGRFVDWCRERGVRRAFVGNTARIAGSQADSTYKALGFEHVGALYSMEFSDVQR